MESNFFFLFLLFFFFKGNYCSNIPETFLVLNVAHAPDINQVPRPMTQPRCWFSLKTLRCPLPSNGFPVGGEGGGDGSVGFAFDLLGR